MITDYQSLQDSIADWLIRTDLSAVIPTFIQNAESALRRDPRVRNLRSTPFQVDSEEEPVPNGFVSLESLYIDGPTFFGEVDIMSAGELAEVNRRRGGTARVPKAAAFIGSVIRFAPPPDALYTFRMTYWETITRLVNPSDTNWLLDDHSDVYLYGSLVHSAPYLRDDTRVASWRQEYDRALEELWQHVERQQYSGVLIKRNDNPIP